MLGIKPPPISAYAPNGHLTNIYVLTYSYNYCISQFKIRKFALFYLLSS